MGAQQFTTDEPRKEYVTFKTTTAAAVAVAVAAAVATTNQHDLEIFPSRATSVQYCNRWSCFLLPWPSRWG